MVWEIRLLLTGSIALRSIRQLIVVIFPLKDMFSISEHNFFFWPSKIWKIAPLPPPPPWASGGGSSPKKVKLTLTNVKIHFFSQRGGGGGEAEAPAPPPPNPLDPPLTVQSTVVRRKINWTCCVFFYKPQKRVFYAPQLRTILNKARSCLTTHLIRNVSLYTSWDGVWIHFCSPRRGESANRHRAFEYDCGLLNAGVQIYRDWSEIFLHLSAYYKNIYLLEKTKWIKVIEYWQEWQVWPFRPNNKSTISQLQDKAQQKMLYCPLRPNQKS